MTSILGNVIIILPSKLVKGGFEIKDEGIDNVYNKGLDLGHKIFLLLCIALTVFNKFNDRTSFDIGTLMFAFSVTRYYTEYKFSKELNTFYYLVLSSFICIVFLLCHIFLH